MLCIPTYSITFCGVTKYDITHNKLNTGEAQFNEFNAKQNIKLNYCKRWIFEQTYGDTFNLSIVNHKAY